MAVSWRVAVGCCPLPSGELGEGGGEDKGSSIPTLSPETRAGQLQLCFHFVTVIKPELDLALLLHGNRLGFNYSVPWEIGIPAVIQKTPPSSPLPTDVWHSLSASPQLRDTHSFLPPSLPLLLAG